MKRMVVFAGSLLGLIVFAILAMIRLDISVTDLQPKYANHASMYFDFDGMKVHYRDEGQGEPVLLLHGSFASLHTFEPWTEILKDSLRIIRIDLPGFGLTGPQPEDDYSLAATLWLVDSLRKQLGIERWAIGGNSLGGRIAYEYAGHYPNHVSKLLLIDAAGVPQVDTLSVVRPAVPRNRSLVFQLADLPVMKWLLTVCTPRFWYKSTLKQVYGDPSRITAATIDRYYELLRRQGNRRAFLMRAESVQMARNIVPALPKRISPQEITIPVLIQWGEKDRWIPLSNGKRFQLSLPTSRLIVYPDAGHVPMEEIPVETARDAKRFLMGKL